jgi:hypothetical protein
METDTTTQLRVELDQARSDFRRTADELRRDLEVGQLGLDTELRRNPLTSVAVAGVLGFLLGRASRPAAVLMAMLTGTVVGYTLASKVRASAARGGGTSAGNDGTSR